MRCYPGVSVLALFLVVLVREPTTVQAFAMHRRSVGKDLSIGDLPPKKMLHRSNARTLCILHLFFKGSQRQQQQGQNTLTTVTRIPSSFSQALAIGSLDLPCRTLLKRREKETILTIRTMQDKDIPSIATIISDEYGVSSPKETKKVPQFRRLGDSLDQEKLNRVVDITMRMKLVPKERPILDHAVIVASFVTKEEEKVVGLIEVSRQPVISNRNPSPIPFPLGFKKFYCKLTKKPLEAWISNLLVDPEARGLGLGRTLVAAAEGLAQHNWQCQSIHLHCDADTVRGRVPQILYTSLGYEPGLGTEGTADDEEKLSWIMQEPDAASYSSSVHIIDGVPLLYMRKELKRIAS